jgi:hypothetical protein
MDTVILVTGAATVVVAFVAVLIVAAVAAIPIFTRAPERTDLAGTSGDEDEFTVEAEPDWWPEFERRFADHAAAWRRGRRLS